MSAHVFCNQCRSYGPHHDHHGASSETHAEIARLRERVAELERARDEAVRELRAIADLLQSEQAWHSNAGPHMRKLRDLADRLAGEKIDSK